MHQHCKVAKANAACRIRAQLGPRRPHLVRPRHTAGLQPVRTRGKASYCTNRTAPVLTDFSFTNSQKDFQTCCSRFYTVPALAVTLTQSHAGTQTSANQPAPHHASPRCPSLTPSGQHGPNHAGCMRQPAVSHAPTHLKKPRVNPVPINHTWRSAPPHRQAVCVRQPA